MIPDSGVETWTPATDQDLSLWLTYKEAANVLGVERKTIQRMVKHGKLQKAMRKRAGLSDVAIVHPGDVMKALAARLAEAKNGMSAFVMPQDTDVDTPAVQDTSSSNLQSVSLNTYRALAAAASMDMSMLPTKLLQALEKIAAAAVPQPAPAVRPSKRIPPDRKHLLTMKEAQELGWPLAQLQEMQKRENPPGIKIGKSKKQFRFSRAALEMELEG